MKVSDYLHQELHQGLTPSFQARGPIRSFDKKLSGQKQDFWLLYVQFWAPSLKNLGAHSKI